MAYDSARGRTVLFGGRDTRSVQGTNELYGDTWEFDGYYWEQRFPANSPPARYAHTMTYDAARRVTVLFGGRLGLDLHQSPNAADVWEWNGNDWAQVTVSGSRPIERFHHGMAYDTVRAVHVIYAGSGVIQIPGGLRFYTLADTWEYDGTARQWTMRSETNYASQQVTLVFDAERNNTLLYIGDAPQKTWTWNANTGIWTALTPPMSPRIAAGGAMAYDSERGVVVLCSGEFDGGGTIADTWEWDGSTWHDKSGSAGEPYFFCCPRDNAAMAYDSRLKQMVLFGGNGAFEDRTWVLQPDIVFVDWQNTGAQGGSDRYPYRTIRQALDSLQCGTIRIQPGSYAETPMTINKAVRLEALNGAVQIH